MKANRQFNKIKGAAGEDIAYQFLLEQGFRVLARNYKCKNGEIDIIAIKGEVLHFVEVKNRLNDMVAGRFAVNMVKQKHIREVAKHYLMGKGLIDKYLVSFDVIEITHGELEFLENCFY